MTPLSWHDFKERLDALVPKTRYFSTSGSDGRSRPLFRGHRSNTWKLETTLERNGLRDIQLYRYMQDCASVRRYAGNYASCSIPFEEGASVKYRDLVPNFPNFEYLAYLRHHGFPSPLLDWTESPYVAAFFAFREPPPPEATAVRVYLYYSDLGQGRGYSSSNAHIHLLGPFATVHERHAIQQCWYTVSLKEQNENCVFCSHEEAISLSESEGSMQDKVEFIDVAISSREEALADLYAMNISPYTLFRSLDSLIETASHRILKIR
jgi:hypothetical protein